MYDKGLKALSARVMRAAPDHDTTHSMRAMVLGGNSNAWKVGPRSAADLQEAATHYERAAVLSYAPASKAELTQLAGLCRSCAGW